MAMASDTDGLMERFETIAALDVRAAFVDFEPDEIRALRAYTEVCGDLNARQLLREGARFNFSAGVAGEGERLEHAGEEALRSAMNDFRLLWADGEPTQFSRVRGILRRRIAPAVTSGSEAAAALDALKKDMSDARKKVVLGGQHPGTGETYPVTRAAELIDDWLFGVSIHRDADRAGRVAAWPPQTYEWMLVSSVNDITNVCLALAVLVDGVLAAQGTGGS
jgi:hypothetical protein